MTVIDDYEKGLSPPGKKKSSPNDCKYLHGDWCHCPKYCDEYGQDYCEFLNREDANKFCKEYQPKKA